MSLHKIFRAFFLAYLSTLIVFSAAFAYDNHDFQVWNTDVEEFKLNKNSKLIFEQEFRWGDNASDFYYQHYDTGYQYIFNKYVSLGGGFRYIKDKKADKFRDESEPYLAAYTYWDLFGFKFSDRTRIEYRYYDYQVNSWRFRNKLDMKFPWKFTRFEIQPLVADEIFFKFNGIDINENRLYAGLAFTLTKNLKGELTYLLKSNKNPTVCTWTDINVLSIKLKAAF
jgi:hypothetical protein